MKMVLLLTCMTIGLVQVAQAAPKDPEMVMSCTFAATAANFGVQTIFVYSDQFSDRYFVQVNGSENKTVISAEEFDQGNIYIGQDGEVDLYLKRSALGQWQLVVRGDGEQFYPAICK